MSIWPAPWNYHVNRGGSWLSVPRSARVAYRDDVGPGIRNYNLGFRLTRRCP